MLIKYIGYVSIPFGRRGRTDFTRIYTEQIHQAPRLATGDPDVLLFREDSAEPPWRPRHQARIIRFQGRDRSHETQLRRAIQLHIVASDFVVAMLTSFNANVMLEIGYAQAQKKPIIYLLQQNQLKRKPTNLENLKRLIPYEHEEDIKHHLHARIQEVVSSLEQQLQRAEVGQPAREYADFDIDYYPNRRTADLSAKFRRAQKEIQILTTNLTTVSADFIDDILGAIKENSDLTVRILTSDPSNDFINPRADQLVKNKRGYRMELQGSLESIHAELKDYYPRCEVRTYKDFPVQLWHRIDNIIYIGQSSTLRRTRHNCVYGVSTDTPGIKETYLDHFERLWGNASSPGSNGNGISKV